MFFLLRRDTQEPGEDLLKIQRTARCGKPGSDAGGRRRLLFHRRPSGLPGDQYPLKQMGIGAVIMPKGELIEVKRQVALRHMMKRAHDLALEEAPEALNSLGVDRGPRPAHIFARAVADGLRPIPGAG